MDQQETLRDILHSVEGWLDPDDAWMLAEYAARVQEPNVIVELGAYRGRSSCVIGTVCNVPFYSVDCHAPSIGDPFQFGDLDREVWTKNIFRYGLSQKVRPINLESQDVGLIWNGEKRPVGLLFVDAGHSEALVSADLSAWIPSVISNGIIVAHDNYGPGIQAAINKRHDLKFVEAIGITSVYTVIK